MHQADLPCRVFHKNALSFQLHKQLSSCRRHKGSVSRVYLTSIWRLKRHRPVNNATHRSDTRGWGTTSPLSGRRRWGPRWMDASPPPEYSSRLWCAPCPLRYAWSWPGKWQNGKRFKEVWSEQKSGSHVYVCSYRSRYEISDLHQASTEHRVTIDVAHLYFLAYGLDRARTRYCVSSGGAARLTFSQHDASNLPTLTFFKTFMANIFPEVAPDTFRTWKTCKNDFKVSPQRNVCFENKGQLYDLGKWQNNSFRKTPQIILYSLQYLSEFCIWCFIKQDKSKWKMIQIPRRHTFLPALTRTSHVWSVVCIDMWQMQGAF